MTNDQAEAILEAERVLQRVGKEGPDSYHGSAWTEYIREARAILEDPPKGSLWRCPVCKDVTEFPVTTDKCICIVCDCDRDRFDPVDVIFLTDWEGEGVFAIFPGIASTRSCITCYAPIGQHSGASFDYCDDQEEITDPSVYADLVIELNRVGYNLRVVSKDRLYDAKYAEARRKQLGGF